MTIPYIPEEVDFANGQSTVDFFQAFTNYMRMQCELHGNKTFARYYEDQQFKQLSYAQLNYLATNLSCQWADRVKHTLVVTLIGDQNIHYLITMLALLKLRVTLMTISPRNSSPAIINLLQKTKSKVVFANVKYQSIIEESVPSIGDVKVYLISNLDINTLLQEPLNRSYTSILDHSFSKEDIEKPAMIIHSSGSTSFPKPIYLSNRYLLNMLCCFGIIKKTKMDKQDITSDDCILTCVPVFHILGFLSTFHMTSFGASCVFLEKLPASQEVIHDALTQNKCTWICAPPIIYEEMIPYLKEKNNFESVKNLKVSCFGGANLKRETIIWLHENKINTFGFYGATEAGAVMASNLYLNSKITGYIQPIMKDANDQYYCQFEPFNDEGLVHLYIRGDSPCLANGVINRPDGHYSTNDLFREHPEYPGNYYYIGRSDDILIMENGEKTNPVPMEATIRQSRVVKQVAVLGHDRQCTCALVEINMENAVELDPRGIIKAVEDAVKEANDECPNHSVIVPQMIKILPLNKTLPSTDKGTVMRKRAEQMYIELVNQAYNDFLEGLTIKNTQSITTLTIEQTKEFLIGCAAEILFLPEAIIAEDESRSLFDHGLNSLSSIQLRNRLAEHFDDLPQNFLFQHPSITSMCETLVSEQVKGIAEQMEKGYQQTQALADAYIVKAKVDFGKAINDYSASNNEKVILLTGATGSIGSFMLVNLLKDPSVKKVYCAVRGKQEYLMSRIVDAFKQRSLDNSILNTDRVEVLPMRFNDKYLGFGKVKHDQLREEVTIIQHCAWLLDFNQPIDHYNRECIAPFYNLLKFAYHQVNPMHVHFVSSVSASACLGSEVKELPLPFDSHVSMPMGYAQSKFVVEQLLNYLSKEKNFPCYIERLGQVCGDSINGSWNASEQYPLMFIGGGSVMKKMPNLDTNIDWISNDYAAAAIADIMLKTSHWPANNANIYHIVNPRMIHWKDVLEAMKQAGMKFGIVSPEEWVQRLEKDDNNPAFKLISFYQVNFQSEFKMPTWSTEKTSQLAPVLLQSPVLDADLFNKYLKHWQSVGFYNPLL